MLETGVGRATNLALAALPGFTLPGDTSASARYFHDDLTEPFVLEPDGTMLVPQGPGIGVEPRAGPTRGVHRAPASSSHVAELRSSIRGLAIAVGGRYDPEQP